jgi:hypothetical protein
MKRIGDWLYVLGVNTLDQHLSYITLRGARKRDHPQSFSYHEPWWEAYHVMAEYFTRLSLAMSSGEEVNPVLVIEPTTTAWMYQGERHLSEIGDSFQKLVTDLSKAQVEYDIGCEDIIGRERDVAWREFRVGRRGYDLLVLPPQTENLNVKTVEPLEAYVGLGGQVLCCGPPPSHVDGVPSDRVWNLSQEPSWKQIDTREAVELIQKRSQRGLVVDRDKGDQGILFHQRRRLDDGEILFMVNTSIDAPSAGRIESTAKGIERLDPATGEISPYPFSETREGVRAEFSLPPCGSLLLFLSQERRGPAKPKVDSEAAVEPVVPIQIDRLEPNVLTLDYVDVTAGGETKKNVCFYAANRFAFQKNGMAGNPWDSSVQFRDELITKTFPPESGFEAAYRFTIEQQVPDPLQIVIERPDLYTITCNGRPVAAKKGAWWLDKSFGTIDISRAAQVGPNAVTITASPFTIYHELEPAYLLGNFSLRAADSGFVILPDVPLKLGPWNEQGHPMYAAGVTYTQQFDVPQPSGRYYVSLPKWYGSVAKVTVGGKTTGYIAYQPWQREVTDVIKPGMNTVEVVVIGTLKNTLGPHHAGSVVGRAWPNMFQVGPATGPPPGKKYHTLGYGLFEPFVLKHVAQ